MHSRFSAAVMSIMHVSYYSLYKLFACCDILVKYVTVDIIFSVNSFFYLTVFSNFKVK